MELEEEKKLRVTLEQQLTEQQKKLEAISSDHFTDSVQVYLIEKKHGNKIVISVLYGKLKAVHTAHVSDGPCLLPYPPSSFHLTFNMFVPAGNEIICLPVAAGCTENSRFEVCTRWLCCLSIT